eukprot:2566467-Rhodomonas_salina.2
MQCTDIRCSYAMSGTDGGCCFAVAGRRDRGRGSSGRAGGGRGGGGGASAAGGGGPEGRGGASSAGAGAGAGGAEEEEHTVVRVYSLCAECWMRLGFAERRKADAAGAVRASRWMRRGRERGRRRTPRSQSAWYSRYCSPPTVLRVCYATFLRVLHASLLRYVPMPSLRAARY